MTLIGAILEAQASSEELKQQILDELAKPDPDDVVIASLLDKFELSCTLPGSVSGVAVETNLTAGT